MYDSNGSLINVNKAVCDFAKMTESEILARACNAVFCKSTCRETECPVMECIHTNKSASREFIIFGRNCIVNADPIFDDTGKLTNVVKSAYDITDLIMVRKEQQKQKELLKAVIDNSQIGIALKDPDDNFKYILCNELFCKKMRMTEDEIIGKTDNCLNGVGGKADEFRLEDLQAMESNVPILFKNDIILPNGKRVVLKKFKVPVVQGNKTVLLVIYIDVTELTLRLESAQAIKKCMNILMSYPNTENALNSVIEIIAKHIKADRAYYVDVDMATGLLKPLHEYRSSSDSISMLGMDYKRIDKNQEWANMLLNHQPIRENDVILPEAQAKLGEWTEIHKMLNIKSVYVNGIYIYEKLRGCFVIAYENEKHVLSKIEYYLLDTIAHIIEVAIDKHDNEKKLISALRKAVEASSAKSFFLASLSHEIRTPLNAVMNFAHHLNDTSISPSERKEYSQNIENAGESLLCLINNVIDLSTIESDHFQLSNEKTDVEKLCLDSIKLFDYSILQKKLGLNIDIKPIPILILDSNRLRQIIFNVIGNAVKYTENGHITIKADFSQETDTSGTLKISITDTGVGIHEQDIENIFEPFVQLTTTRGTSSKNHGSGVGLSVSKKIINHMGGNISVQSRLGEGSTFIISIPEVKFSNKSSTEVLKTDSSVKLNKNVLIIDDVKLNLKVLSILLDKIGVKSISAQSGEEALKIIKNHNFDAVLTDLWMPEMNGEDLAKEIKILYPDMPIAAITADVVCQDNFDLSIFDAILKKPTSLKKLLEFLS